MVMSDYRDHDSWYSFLLHFSSFYFSAVWYFVFFNVLVCEDYNYMSPSSEWIIRIILGCKIVISGVIITIPISHDLPSSYNMATHDLNDN